MNTLITDYLSRIELREPQQCMNAVIIPIFATTNAELDYLTLTEALEQRLATITEISQGGHVPNIKVANHSDLFLLLVDGEELIGARQNRTLNTSILVAGKSEIIVPVSCTERGRWSYKSAMFADAGYVSPHKLRKIKSSSVGDSLKQAKGHSSSQHEVWCKVADYAVASHVHSPTSAMHDTLAARAKELEQYTTIFKALPNQRGLIVLVNGEITGADIISSARAYQVLHSKFLRSYVLDALLDQRAAGIDKPQEKAASFLEAFKTSTERIHPVVGCGEDYRFEGPGIRGAALVAARDVVHLNVFRN